MKDVKEVLQHMTEQVMKTALATLMRNGSVTPVAMLLGPNEQMLEFEMPRFMAMLMNDGRGKDALFNALRGMVNELECKGICIATETWFGHQTGEGLKLSPREFQRILSKNGMEKAEKLGICSREESITVVAQTPEVVVITVQIFHRDGDAIQLGTRHVNELSSTQFDGRMKMYPNPMEGPVQ